MPNILGLEQEIKKLEKHDPESFRNFINIFRVNSSEGRMIIPETFQDKAWEYFGIKKNGKIVESKENLLKRLEKQCIINIFNLWTCEGSLFNSLRAQRPGINVEVRKKEIERISEHIKDSEDGCDFCQIEKFTPEDIFGRVEGKYCITGSNIAKYDSWNSIIFFRCHDPHKFTLLEISDYLDTAGVWFLKVKEQDPEYKFPFFLWNCLSKAGASQIHGHAQILMSKKPYAKVQMLKWASERYKKETNRNYFSDLFKAHEAVGLTMGTVDLGTIVSLTPNKEKEIIIITKESPYENKNVKKIIYNNLKAYTGPLGVTSFNLSISNPSLDGNDDFPYIIRMVDRGSIFKSTADMAAMELYGSSVIADDPYSVIQILKKYTN